MERTTIRIFSTIRTRSQPPDALGEFKVSTNSYSAQYGRGGGAVISATIRSGSNQFHGSVYNFLRNDNLDARNFFADRKGELIRNQFGGTIGGPVKRDKSFFFFSYEGTRIRTHGTDTFSTVPTLTARSGDLRDYKPIYDPVTRAPFPDNTIPAARIDPVARSLTNMWPEPNRPGIFRNYLGRTTGREDRDKFDWRFDQTFSERDTLFFRFSLQQSRAEDENNLPLLVDGQNVNFSFRDVNSRSAALGETHTFSGTTVNDFRPAFHWTRADQTWATGEIFASAFGIPGLLPPMLATPGLPNYSVAGVASIGGQGFRPNLMCEQTLQVADSLFLIRGAHTLKLGGETRTQHIPFSVAQRAGGEYQFTGNFTLGPAGTGEGLADFLLGYPQSVRVQNRPSAADMRRFIYAGFLNDDWKATSRLTLDLGVRYEFVTPLFESKNHFASFDPGTGQLREATSGSLESRSLIKPDYNQFAPRLGLAWQLASATVVRAGYGMFFSGEEPIGAGRWLQNNPSITFEANLVATPPNPLVTLQKRAPRSTSFSSDTRCMKTTRWKTWSASWKACGVWIFYAHRSRGCELR